MADEVQCPDCRARYRLRLRSQAVDAAEIACPKCGAAIPLDESAPEVEAPDDPLPESAASTGGGHKSWESIDYGSLFGHPPASAPDRPDPSPQPPPADPAGSPSEGSNRSTDQPPRLPEDDRRDGERELARQLLRRLDRPDASSAPSEPATSGAELEPAPPVSTPPTADSAPKGDVNAPETEVEPRVDDGESTYRIRPILGTAMVFAAVVTAAVAFVVAPWQSDDPTAPSPVSEKEAAEEEQRSESQRVLTAVHTASNRGVDAADIDPVDLVEQIFDRADYRRARLAAIDAVGHTSEPDRLQRLFDRSIQNDPDLQRRILTIEPGRHADAFRALGGGSSVTFRLTRGGENLYAYKVDREEWEDGWRTEIAAFKFAALLPFGLDVPFNAPARISREDFDELYGRIETPYQRDYADRRFDELIWTTESGPDGIERDYLYGTLKEWIPHYTNWPVEYVDTWAPWLDPEAAPQNLDEDYGEFEARLREVYDGPLIAELQDEVEDHSTRRLARQISNLHVFDYLTTNHDRYSGIEDYYGVNAHFADGRFIPIDNSAAFQFSDTFVDRMDRRIRRVGRFSRSTIDGVRLLRPQAVEPVLFPEPTRREQQRLELFWQQRDKLLEYVDELVEKYGEEAVYAFE